MNMRGFNKSSGNRGHMGRIAKEKYEVIEENNPR